MQPILRQSAAAPQAHAVSHSVLAHMEQLGLSRSDILCDVAAKKDTMLSVTYELLNFQEEKRTGTPVQPQPAANEAGVEVKQKCVIC
jgi:hypothetical protein